MHKERKEKPDRLGFIGFLIDGIELLFLAFRGVAWAVAQIAKSLN